MSRTVAIVLAVAVCLIGASATPSVAAPRDGHGWQVHCGGDSHGLGYGWFDSKGFNVSCRSVRRVANHYTFKKPGDRKFNGWRCDADRAGPSEFEDSRVDCKRRQGGRHQHVRFKVGV
jgi:hypothetical protein